MRCELCGVTIYISYLDGERKMINPLAGLHSCAIEDVESTQPQSI